VLLLVSSVRRKVEEHPDVDPASRRFLGIKLSTVYREHENNIVLSDTAIAKCFYEIRSLQDIRVFVWTTVFLRVDP